MAMHLSCKQDNEGSTPFASSMGIVERIKTEAKAIYTIGFVLVVGMAELAWCALGWLWWKVTGRR